MNKKIERRSECPEYPACPICGANSKYDMEKWPPKQTGKKLICHYICDGGHKFGREIYLK